jgi:hypothetical protein
MTTNIFENEMNFVEQLSYLSEQLHDDTGFLEICTKECKLDHINHYIKCLNIMKKQVEVTND